MLNYLNKFEVLVKKESITDTDLSEGLGPSYFRPDASTFTTLCWQTHPVVPVRSGPAKNKAGSDQYQEQSLMVWFETGSLGQMPRAPPLTPRA